MAGQGFCGGGGCLPGSRPLPEQAPPAPPAAVRAGMAVAAGRGVFLRAGGLALVDQVVAFLAGRRGLAAGLQEAAARIAAAAGGAERAGLQQGSARTGRPSAGGRREIRPGVP
jgi:hypothetical protein